MEEGASGAAASPSDLRKAETLEDIWSELPVAGTKLRASLCLSKRGVGKSRSFIFPTQTSAPLSELASVVLLGQLYWARA